MPFNLMTFIGLSTKALKWFKSASEDGYIDAGELLEIIALVLDELGINIRIKVGGKDA